VLAEEMVVLDADSLLWSAARPLLEAALRLEQREDNYSWHGWNKRQINAFLAGLPRRCSLVVGVWETSLADNDAIEHEELLLGVVCEVGAGEVCSIRTYDALTAFGLGPTKSLEPGIDDALEIMRVVKSQVAPVAWALFTDKTTWDEWLFASSDRGDVADKGDMLTAFARQGRCVIMGNQTVHHY
jgi:hypothetical protein